MLFQALRRLESEPMMRRATFAAAASTGPAASEVSKAAAEAADDVTGAGLLELVASMTQRTAVEAAKSTSALGSDDGVGTRLQFKALAAPPVMALKSESISGAALDIDIPRSIPGLMELSPGDISAAAREASHALS